VIFHDQHANSTENRKKETYFPWNMEQDMELRKARGDATLSYCELHTPRSTTTNTGQGHTTSYTNSPTCDFPENRIWHI